ncbi:MAG: pyruvate kinase [Clostridiales bacterium]|nr:pyruvate kinase [Clostridiales bacterium]
MLGSNDFGAEASLKKTKIICTLGPAVNDRALLGKLLLAGVNAVRVNFSHGTHESHKAMLDQFKEVRDELGLSVATILDTKGPEIRIKTFRTGLAELVRGETFVLTTDEAEGDGHRVSVTYKNLHNELHPGDRILIDDGLVELSACEIRERDIICTVENGGVITNHKSVNIPGVNIRFSELSKEDEKDIRFAVENDMDYIAASFIRSREDVLAVKNVLSKYGGEDIKVIAKIENSEGVKNLDEIIEVSDALMVARGDLGVEVPAWDVPVIQKRMISEGIMAGKPVIVATQMLDSMIRNPRPTRAEISDVANAVFDGASCVMLSGETASGKYPLESVMTMTKTILAAEEAINYWKRFRRLGFEKRRTSVADAVSHACCMTAMDLGASAIITITSKGHTPRMISRFRPACPIIAVTESEKVRRQLSISWGVTPIVCQKHLSSTDEAFEEGVSLAARTRFVKNGDTIVLTAGVPVGISGSTNLIKAQQIT